MKNAFGLLLFYFNYLSLFGQGADTITQHKWVNYPFPPVQLGINQHWNRQYITTQKDTLERYFQFTSSAESGELLMEKNLVHGELNGPLITYHNNGRIRSIDYYLNDKPWETNVLMDSLGNQHFPGTLINGTGVIPFMGEDGEDLGFMTFKNGNADGQYRKISKGQSVVTEGVFLYSDTFLQYDTMTMIHYINEYNDSMTAVLWNSNGNDSVAISYLANKDAGKITTLQKNDFKVARQGINTILNLYLSPGVIPTGEWRVRSLKNNKIFFSYKFDDTGKPLSVTDYDLNMVYDYNEDGSYKERSLNR